MQVTSSAPLPLRHLSIRVPWHDSGWDGRVCQDPARNTACLKLARIAESRDDAAEDRVKGQSLKVLKESDWPCCVHERGMFMAPFEITRLKQHPYASRKNGAHQHFAPTPFRLPPFSADAIPFLWVQRERMSAYAEEHGLDVQLGREPDLGFETKWVQELSNQRSLLDCFFGHIRPASSLVFFYAKQVPFVDQPGRVLIGVGRVNHIGEPVEYRYSQPGPLKSMLWERAIQHSIRPGYADGFLLPYQAALAHAADNPEFDPASIAAMAPNERFEEFAFVSEHMSHDTAIASLLALAAALSETRKALEGPWDECLRWVDARLAELWRMRGPCPGLGAALGALGVENSSFVARELAAKLKDNEDPWPLVDRMFASPGEVLSRQLAAPMSEALCRTYAALKPDRRALLKLLSRFNILPDHAKMVFVEEERHDAGIATTDAALLANPYLIYEQTRLSANPVTVTTVDRGVFPEAVVREVHPLSAPSLVASATDGRRVRALAISALEQAAIRGHTMLPQSHLVRLVREFPVNPTCALTRDLLGAITPDLAGEIEIQAMADGSPAYQLTRLREMGAIIRTAIEKRISGVRHTVNADWSRLLVEAIGPVPADDPDEDRARTEKTAALAELAASRFSVLIGPAGVGKTKLLSVLCSHPDVAAGEVLLLAPTGKARVRMEEAARRLNAEAFTLAQFLSRSGRYDGETGRYQLAGTTESAPQTVIVDEASMLTEEMLAALLDALKRGVHRLILVGDPRQLPPIGAGRPFSDIVRRLAPPDVAARFPRVSMGYAELTVPRRQGGRARSDLRLAAWFGGEPIGPAEEDVFDSDASGDGRVQFVRWDTPDEFERALLQTIVSELRLEGVEDQQGFEQRLGGVLSNGFNYFNLGAEARVDDWQVLSPVRGFVHGVARINRLMHQQFRSRMTDLASSWTRKIPAPMGPEGIVYGDKVMNTVNHRREWVWPDVCKKTGRTALQYVANGEIGLAIGFFWKQGSKDFRWKLEVAFSSQPGFKYDYSGRDFGDESDSPLELAYALTVHKAQGSEFGTTIVVVPNPCQLLSRELLYTALTRQRERLVVLHQGDRASLKKFASDHGSETARRITNLFRAPTLVEVRTAPGVLFEEGLINQTVRGELVRSKSEVIIADRLHAAGVDYDYEKPLTLEGPPKYPDFTIEDDASGRKYVWEHLGLLADPGYRARWEAKLAWYRRNGVLPHDEGGGVAGTLIITRDDERGGISSQQIEQLIQKTILA